MDMSSRQKNKLKWIRGHSYVDGTSKLRTSLRAEHHGTVVILLFSHMLRKRWNLTNDIPPVTILVDNKEVITYIQSGMPCLSIKIHLAHMYGLWAEALHLTNTLPFPIQW